MSIMNIEVWTLTGRTVQYYMSRESRVIDLQNEIAEREGLSPDSQYIIMNLRVVRSDERLGEIGMQGDTITAHLLSKVVAGMNVKVVCLTGEITVEIEKNKTTVQQLKAEIEGKKGIAVHKQRLVVSDGVTETEMKDKDKVIDYLKEGVLTTYTISLLSKVRDSTLEPLIVEPSQGEERSWFCCQGRSCSIL